MALLIRCQSCKRWFSPNKPNCPKCETAWDIRGAPKAFYHDFTLHGTRRRVKAKAKSIHYAKVENDSFDPEVWWRAKQETKREKKKRLTVRQAFDGWFEDSKLFGCRRRKIVPNRPKTLESKETSFKNYILPFIGKKPMEEVTTEDLRQIVAFWMKHPEPRNGRVRTPQSINLDIRYMRSFFGWARRKGLILVDPTESDDFGFLEEPEIEKQKLTFEQVSTFLKVLRENPEIPLVKRRLIEFWLWTGLRAWSEAANLQWKWIHWQKREIQIPSEHTKSRKGLRRTLSDRAWSILEEMKLYREDGNAYVFRNPQTSKPFGDLRKTIKRSTQATGMGENITPKDFRHNFISWTDQENALATQEVIGHSGLVVEKSYFHMDHDTKRRFENRIVEKMTGRVQSCVHGASTLETNVGSA